VANGSHCEAKFGKKAQHAFVDDTIDWEFINTCPADKNVTLAPDNGSTNPFTTSPPWTTSVPQNNGASPAVLSLVVSPNALGSYSFGITVDGQLFDPKLEIDPYK
jgi:hypothetical protein